MAINNTSIKVTDATLRFFVKLKHNVKTVRMNNSPDVLKVKEPSTHEALDMIVNYFKLHNNKYTEMITEYVKSDDK